VAEVNHRIPGFNWNLRRRKDWLSFKEARAFARSLGLRNEYKWREFSKTDAKPTEIPSQPQDVYAEEWMGWGDWLGTGNRKGGYLPFEEARSIVRKLQLPNTTAWVTYWKSYKPNRIPANPRVVYWSQFKGYGDWLGTGRIRGHIATRAAFLRARAFIRSLHLQTFEGWLKYCRSGQRPSEIPANPDSVYRAYWRGWSDWVGGHGNTDPEKLKVNVLFAEKLARKNQGALPNSQALRIKHTALAGYMQRYPNKFSHVPQEVLDTKGRLTRFKNGTAAQRRALEIRFGLRKKRTSC
jgi:hypothetical protein